MQEKEKEKKSKAEGAQALLEADQTSNHSASATDLSEGCGRRRESIATFRRVPSSNTFTDLMIQHVPRSGRCLSARLLHYPAHRVALVYQPEVAPVEKNSVPHGVIDKGGDL